MIIQPLVDGTKGNTFQKIYDETDYIGRYALENRLQNDDLSQMREHKTFDKIKIPGIDRNQMPEKPEKSENLRKAEKSQMHPFISFEVSDFERFSLLEAFENMMKEKESERNWNFGDRIYEERYAKNTLSQSIFKTTLLEPEMSTKYYDKEDALLVSLYFRNPPGRILRKKWTADWRVIPNLENWINFFKPEERNYKNDFYYDIDYQIIDHIYEKVKLMYPDDDSVIICPKYQIGNEIHYHYKVYKENVIFGIRNPVEKTNPFSEFWAVFENQTKLMVEMEKEYDPNIQNSNLEENKDNLSPREEIYKATFSLTLQNSLIVKFLANGDILQTISSNKLHRFKKHFDEVLTDSIDKEDKNEKETSRIITGKATVVRYMQDGSTQILYANGNVAINKKNGIWVTTNNKGLRKGRKVRDDSEIEYDPIPCARKTDPETGCKILIREDKVMVITYPDGSRYTVHRDGTRFLTHADGNTYIVEHDSKT